MSNAIETTEEVTTEDLASFFKEDRLNYSDSDILHISKQLQKINRIWSQVPRTYIVLRQIGKVNHLDSLIDLGFTDLWFPVREKSLPDFLGSSTKAEFVRAQASILTKSCSLEKGEEGTYMHFAKGEMIPFKSMGELGSGGFGSVDRVQSQMTQNQYARKLIRRKDLFRPAREVAKDYIRELEVLKRIKHHHIVELVGSYTDARYLGLIMSPVADSDLRNYLTEMPFPGDKIPVLSCFFGCLAAALAYLHENNIRHKDIKPENILIKGTTVLFTDFGISRDSTDASRNTTEGLPVMTPRYCAPEVAESLPRSYPSDIWSLGCVFLEMISVIKGKTVEKMREFFLNHGTRKEYIRNNLGATNEWIDTLQGIPLDSDNKPLEWITRTLQINPNLRLSAPKLMGVITNFRDNDRAPSQFCGACCVDDHDFSEPEDNLFNESGVSFSSELSLRQKHAKSNSLDDVSINLDPESLTPYIQSSGKARDSVVQQISPLDSFAREFLNEKIFMWAVEEGREAIVSKMCHSGANTVCFDNRRRSPLHIAAEKGHMGIVQLLIRSGADINSKSDFNWTPAMTAVHNDQYAVVELIRAHAISKQVIPPKFDTEYLSQVILFLDSDWGWFFLDSLSAKIQLVGELPDGVNRYKDYFLRLGHSDMLFEEIEIHFNILHKDPLLAFTVDFGYGGTKGGQNGYIRVRIVNGGQYEVRRDPFKKANATSFQNIPTGHEIEVME